MFVSCRTVRISERWVNAKAFFESPERDEHICCLILIASQLPQVETHYICFSPSWKNNKGRVIGDWRRVKEMLDSNRSKNRNWNFYRAEEKKHSFWLASTWPTGCLTWEWFVSSRSSARNFVISFIASTHYLRCKLLFHPFIHSSTHPWWSAVDSHSNTLPYLWIRSSFFSRGHATLQLAVSVGRSVRRSVGTSHF